LIFNGFSLGCYTRRCVATQVPSLCDFYGRPGPHIEVFAAFFSSYFFDFYTYTYFISFQEKCFEEGKGKKKLRKKISSAYTCAGSRNMVNAFDLTWRWIYVSKIIAIFYSWSLEFIACFPFLNLLSNYNCKYVCFCIALLRIILSTTHRFFKCIF
jgi:hypothetical protein